MCTKSRVARSDDLTMQRTARHVSGKRATALLGEHTHCCTTVRYSRKDGGHVQAGQRRSGLAGLPHTSHSRRAASRSGAKSERLEGDQLGNDSSGRTASGPSRCPARRPASVRPWRLSFRPETRSPARRTTHGPSPHGPSRERSRTDQADKAGRRAGEVTGLDDCSRHRRCRGVHVRGIHDELHAFHRTPTQHSLTPDHDRLWAAGPGEVARRDVKQVGGYASEACNS